MHPILLHCKNVQSFFLHVNEKMIRQRELARGIHTDTVEKRTGAWHLGQLPNTPHLSTQLLVDQGQASAYAKLSLSPNLGFFSLTKLFKQPEKQALFLPNLPVLLCWVCSDAISGHQQIQKQFHASSASSCSSRTCSMQYAPSLQTGKRINKALLY